MAAEAGIEGWTIRKDYRGHPLKFSVKRLMLILEHGRVNGMRQRTEEVGVRFNSQPSEHKSPL